jgi:IS5 family transposase
MESQRDGQTTFFDLAQAQRGSANVVLETIAREVDFRGVEARIGATYGSGGRPACRAGVLLRIMILQHLYGLSDPQAEAQIKDRLSFQKFLELGAEEAVPDETTICRFRQRLIDCGLHTDLLGLLNQQLEARGYILKRTTLVDATIVESSRKRPSREAVAEGTAPDASAGYTYKNARSYYGYKAHVASDGAHQLIRSAVITSARAYDGHWLTQVVPAGAGVVYADKAYDTKTNHAWLKRHGVADQIMRRGAHHVKLSPATQQANRARSRVRRQIERVFAHFKRWQQYDRVRYLGLVKNQLELTLKAVAYNLKRMVNLQNRHA